MKVSIKTFTLKGETQKTGLKIQKQGYKNGQKLPLFISRKKETTEQLVKTTSFQGINSKGQYQIETVEQTKKVQFSPLVFDAFTLSKDGKKLPNLPYMVDEKINVETKKINTLKEFGFIATDKQVLQLFTNNDNILKMAKRIVESATSSIEIEKRIRATQLKLGVNEPTFQYKKVSKSKNLYFSIAIEGQTCFNSLINSYQVDAKLLKLSRPQSELIAVINEIILMSLKNAVSIVDDKLTIDEINPITQQTFESILN